MTGTNKILPFAQGGTANVLSDAAYAADSQLTIGNQPGIARAQLTNKALRQATVMSAGLANFIANRQANDITDSLTEAQIEAYLQTALNSTPGTLPATISTTPTAWWRKSSDGFIEQGLAGITVPASGGFAAIVFPLTFISTVLDIQVSVFNAAAQQVGWSNVTLSGCHVVTGIGDTLSRVANIRVCGY